MSIFLHFYMYSTEHRVYSTVFSIYESTKEKLIGFKETFDTLLISYSTKCKYAHICTVDSTVQ